MKSKNADTSTVRPCKYKETVQFKCVFERNDVFYRDKKKSFSQVIYSAVHVDNLSLFYKITEPLCVSRNKVAGFSHTILNKRARTDLYVLFKSVH